MNKNLWLVVCLLFFLMAHSPIVVAQDNQKRAVSHVSCTAQQEKEKFLYGFYTAYMSSLIYGVDGLDKILREKYVERKLLKRATDADVLLDAQDCIEENLRTLSVTAIDNDWYRVSFLWSSTYPSVPTRQHVILIKIGDSNKGYKITDIKIEG